MPPVTSNETKDITIDIEDFGFTPAQKEFWNDPHKHKLLVKGRRWGATKSAANYCIKRMVEDQGLSILWVDVIYSNINRYYTRYFAPVLRQFPRGTWKWEKQQKLLTIGKSYIDFKSADRPESIEGFAYGLLILNEAGIILKDRDLWTVSIAPMLMDYDPDVCMIGTPKGTVDKDGEDSLYYELYKRACDPLEPNWQAYQFSTYDNPLIDAKTIAEVEAEIPPVLRQQEIYGEFVNSSEKRCFDEHWFSIIEEKDLPQPPAFIIKIMSLDTAFKTKDESDYSACLVIYQTYTDYYIMDCINEKYEFPDLIKEVNRIYSIYRPDAVCIEDRASGQSLIQTLKRETTYPIRPISPDKDKYTRAVAITPLCESRKVKILRGVWNKMFLNQVGSFPSGHDDIVDALSQGLTYLKTYRGTGSGIVSHKLTIKSNTLRGYDAAYTDE